MLRVQTFRPVFAWSETRCGTERKRTYPRHYLAALAHTDIHIHPQIPLSGYIPGASAVDKMIAVGARATYSALASISHRVAA